MGGMPSECIHYVALSVHGELHMAEVERDEFIQAKRETRKPTIVKIICGRVQTTVTIMPLIMKRLL